MNELKEPQSRRVLSIISVVTFIGFLDTHLLIPVMSLYAKELGAGIGIAGVIVGLYSIINTPANVLLGRLIDRIGHKLPLIVGLVGDALSMFLYSVCRLPVHLALVRVFHGASGGLVGPATMSAMSDYSNRAQRGRTMAFYGMAIAAATLVGNFAGAFIVKLRNYETLFWIGAAIMITGVVLSQLLPKDGKKERLVTENQSAGGFNKVKTCSEGEG